MKYSLLVNRAKKLLNQIESRETAPGIRFITSDWYQAALDLGETPPEGGLLVIINQSMLNAETDCEKSYNAKFGIHNHDH